MKFVLECKYCSRILKEIVDETYSKTVTIKEKDTCKNCGNNLRKLKGEDNGTSSYE